MTENELMLTSILDCRRVDLVVDSKELTPEQKLRYGQMQDRRLRGEPLQYIIGQTCFMGVPLSVDDCVLIPRPETEILVELAIEKLKSISAGDVLNVLDLGTGSGNIPVVLAKNISNCTLTALDINEDALRVAEKNASANDVQRRITFIHRDMTVYLRAAADEDRAFDMIISNPPYIPTAQLAQLPKDVQREPQQALDGGEDGLYFYRTIIQYSHRILGSDGFLLLEIGDGQRDGIEEIFKKYPQYQQIKFHKDYVGTDRIVSAQVGRPRQLEN